MHEIRPPHPRVEVVGDASHGQPAIHVSRAPVRTGCTTAGRSMAVLEPALFVGSRAPAYRESLLRSTERYRAERVSAELKEFFRARWLAYSRGALDLRRVIETGRISQPGLVVLGGDSPQLHPGFEETYRLLLGWLPNAEGFVVPGATHFLQLESAGISAHLADTLATFFSRHPLASTEAVAIRGAHSPRPRDRRILDCDSCCGREPSELAAATRSGEVKLVRVAAAQAASAWLDPAATTRKVVALLEEASRQGAELVAFPEAFLSAPRGNRHAARYRRRRSEIEPDPHRTTRLGSRRRKRTQNASGGPAASWRIELLGELDAPCAPLALRRRRGRPRRRLRADSVPSDFPFYRLIKDKPEGFYHGGSCIVAPDGSWTVEPRTGEEGLICVLKCCARGSVTTAKSRPCGEPTAEAATARNPRRDDHKRA